jgi:ADP-ribosylglycohydrolase
VLPRAIPDGPALRSRFAGALLGAALGDALGSPFTGGQGVPGSAIDGHWLSDEPLRHGDDTEMLIAVAETLIERGTLDPRALTRRLRTAFPEGPRRAHRHTSRDAVAASRVTPVALLCVDDPQASIDLAAASARATHAHPSAVEAAVVQASAVAACLTMASPGDDPRAVVRSVVRHAADPPLARALVWLAGMPKWVTPPQVRNGLGSSRRCEEAGPAALAAFAGRSPDYAEVVRFAIGLGGGTDAIACMAGALSGAAVGECGLPAGQLARLDGSRRIRALAHAVADLRLELA